jgi:hypothetical protein
VYTLQFNTEHFTTVFPLGRVSSRQGPGPPADPTLLRRLNYSTQLTSDTRLSRVILTIDGYWIDNRIYCTLQFQLGLIQLQLTLTTESQPLLSLFSEDSSTPTRSSILQPTNSSAEHCLLFTAGIIALLCSRNACSLHCPRYMTFGRTVGKTLLLALLVV